jgi:hypothetical protein
MLAMKKIGARVIIALMPLFSCIVIHAQENIDPFYKLLKNNINSYISLFEFNINYERNIIQLPKSYTNLRFGFGLINSSFDGGYYYNPVLVHLIGKRNKHLELNLGFKYTIQKGTSNSFFPDVYAGYRYEKPTGGLIFRVGINLFTLYNLGIGFKF